MRSLKRSFIRLPERSQLRSTPGYSGLFQKRPGLFVRMRFNIRSLFLATVLTVILPLSMSAQKSLGVEDLMNDGRPRYLAEHLIIIQDPAIDTLVSRHILMNASKDGVDGWRIQIYRGGHRTANEDSNKVRARFMEEYPDIPTYRTFDRPNWFKVKVGDFRTREEAARVFFEIVGKYPDAYLIRDVIAFKNPVK
jgi:hypothetical protein